jgi:hypothetical protein
LWRAKETKGGEETEANNGIGGGEDDGCTEKGRGEGARDWGGGGKRADVFFTERRRTTSRVEAADARAGRRECGIRNDIVVGPIARSGAVGRPVDSGRRSDARLAGRWISGGGDAVVG